jgi:hypothetical protein
MMLTPLENVFVRIFRVTLVSTAFIALLIAICALLYVAYARFAPEPKANLSRKVDQIRQAVDPAILIKQLFPVDSTVYKDADTIADNVKYESRSAPDDLTFQEFNHFLAVSLGASFDSREQFQSWLYGNNHIEISWDNSIDDKQASNEDNVNYLLKSLLLDYAKRLSFRGASLGSARKQKLYGESFDELTAPTGRSQAPAFLVWFFDKLQSHLLVVNRDLELQRLERVGLRVWIYPSLIAAGSAFGYFLVVMFLFLLVSIEASTRRIAEVQYEPTLPPRT